MQPDLVFCVVACSRCFPRFPSGLWGWCGVGAASSDNCAREDSPGKPLGLPANAQPPTRSLSSQPTTHRDRQVRHHPPEHAPPASQQTGYPPTISLPVQRYLSLPVPFHQATAAQHLRPTGSYTGFLTVPARGWLQHLRAGCNGWACGQTSTSQWLWAAAGGVADLHEWSYAE